MPAGEAPAIQASRRPPSARDAAGVPEPVVAAALVWRAGLFTWIGTGLSLALAALVAILQGFAFSWSSSANLGMALLALGPLALALYARRRGLHGLAAGLAAFAAFSGFNSAALVLQFPMASLAMPLVDAPLAAVDRMLGGDWPAHFAWMTANPTLMTVLVGIYGTLLLQMPLVCALLAWQDRGRLALLILANALALGATVVLASLFPAESGLGFFGTPGYESEPLRQFHAVRDGSLRLLDLSVLSGIITFPSYHTILAVLVLLACRGLPVVGIPLVLLQLVIIFTTRGVGGHYFVDMVAGALIAVAAWQIAARLLGMRFDLALPALSRAPVDARLPQP